MYSQITYWLLQVVYIVIAVEATIPQLITTKRNMGCSIPYEY